MVFFDMFAPQTSQRSRPSFNTKDKEFLYAEQKQKCNGCGVKFPLRNLTVDHIKPFSKGGTEKPSNLQLLCNSCNSMKNNKTQAQLKKRLTEKGIIKGNATATKTKKTTTAEVKTRKTTAAAKKPGKKKAAATRQPARPQTIFDVLDDLTR